MTIKEKDGSIFISIACLDDREIEYTVNSIFNNAKNPQKVFVGIGLAANKKESLNLVKKITKKYLNVKYSYVKQKRNGVETLGVGKGRMRAQMLYDNQDYFMQVDAHSHFEKNWDEKVLNLFKLAVNEVGDDRVILTCIPPRFYYNKQNEPIRSEPETRYPRFVSGFFVGVVPMWQSVNSLDLSKKEIIPSPKANSAFMFGNSKFAKNTGIVPSSIFYDEEILYSINLIDMGFALAFPNVSDFPIMHLDGDQITPGHERTFFSDYLDQKHSDLIHEKFKNNYLSFVNDQKNLKKLQKYKDYAKIDPKRGYFSSQSQEIPKAFR
jgi:hypothetical protein